jgi:putative ABC transport system permease protein
VAGLITGWLNVRLKIMDLLASILMMIALYSVNLRIMGGPNVPLINDPTIFNMLQPEGIDDYIFPAAAAGDRGRGQAGTGLVLRHRTRPGHPRHGLQRPHGPRPGREHRRHDPAGHGHLQRPGRPGRRLFVQTQGGSDISMGIGTIVIGLAAVIVGESILPSRKIVWARWPWWWAPSSTASSLQQRSTATSSASRPRI